MAPLDGSAPKPCDLSPKGIRPKSRMQWGPSPDVGAPVRGFTEDYGTTSRAKEAPHGACAGGGAEATASQPNGERNGARRSSYVLVYEGCVLVRGRERAGRRRVPDLVPHTYGPVVLLGDHTLHQRGSVRRAVPGRGRRRGTGQPQRQVGTGALPRPHP